MQPNLSFDRNIVTTREGEVINVLLELTAPEATALERKPLDIVLVLDRSGSMSGAPLDAVTKAAAQLLRLVGPEDRVGVVAFDDDVDLVLPLGRHGATDASNRVRAIRPGGSTNLSGGWLKGLEMLVSDQRPDALRRIVLLTDGHANAGLRSAEQLLPLVSSGIAQGISTSCIGFADGYDEKLLAGMADAGRGNDYWCAGPDQAMAVFSDEFAGLASVVAQNVSVEINPTAAVATSLVLNEFPITDLPSGGCQVALGDAYGSEVRKVVARFHLRPINGNGPVDVATITVRWASTVGDVALHTVTVPVSIQADANAPTGDAAMDPRVTEEVLVLEVARNRKAARDAAESGDYQTAADLLRSSSALMGRISSASQRDIDELLQDAEELDSGFWSAMNAKKQWSRSRAASKGRKTSYEPELDDPDSDGNGSNPGSGPGSRPGDPN